MLKSLELFGFKSFADRTKFDFDPGITGVVGPNGSGKSNVVDAIKWILGDQSAKSLRGKEMTDVIFNGTPNRKAGNLAEATLTLENTNGLLPIPTREVQIGRRLWRSGDSEYLINRAPARLKDVRDLFMGTGAGRASYCIIEQGRVDQILQANAVTRRGIFEEAAGISRYKARKIEAERKLERVDQNLLRLTDIVEEVDTQLNTIRSQAQKAAKYRELSEELKRLWLGLASDDYRFFSTKLAAKDATIAEFKARLADLQAEVFAHEQNLATRDREIGEVDDVLRDAERRAATNREAIASHEATLRHQATREQELDADLVRLRKQRTTMASRSQEIVSELEHVRGQRDRFEAEFVKRKQELDAKRLQINQLATEIEAGRRQFEQQRARLLERTRETSAVESRVAAMKAQHQQHTADGERLSAERVRIESRITACRAECDRAQGEVDESSEKVRAAESRVAEIKQRRRDLIDAQNRVHRNLADQREQRSACRARKSVLEDLELRQEGLGIGPKEILKRAQELTDEPWTSIRGSVADLLEVDLEQAALLEVSLGNRAQLIVIDKFEPLIEYLNSGAGQISGRVGFIACEAGVSSDFDSNVAVRDVEQFELATAVDLSGHRGVQMRADALVKLSPVIADLPQRLLADTWVVDTLATALELSNQGFENCRFVTLQGELLEADGALTVGTVRSEAALVSRKSELRRLRHDLASLDRAISDEESRLTEVDASLSGIKTDLATADAALKELLDIHVTLRDALADQMRELEAQERERREIETKYRDTQVRRERLVEELQQAQFALAGINDDLQAIQQGLERREREIEKADQHLQTVQQQRAASQLDLAKHEERLESLRSACQRIEQEQRQRDQQREEAERRFETVADKRREIKLHILNTRALLSEMYLVHEKLSAEVSQHSDRRAGLRAGRAEIDDAISSLRAVCRQLDDAQHQEEILARDLRYQVSSLEKRTEEEYQLVLAEVVASGASAYESYCREQFGNEPAPESTESESAEPADETTTTAAALPTFEAVRPEFEERVNKLRRKLQHMGSVNTDSLQDLDELESRFGHLRSQLDDLVEAKRALEEIIRRINQESKRLFNETFDAVRGHFQLLFRKAFGGGDGDVVLEDPNDVLDCGIDIVARPPGKELKSISLMSGGEKTLTAFALLLALFKSRPSPYCLLDEVDAALDEANVGRMLALLGEFKETTQFIVITHKKPTMTIADVLYGVTMEESGVSKKMSVRFEDVSENGDFKSPTQKKGSSQSVRDGESKDAA